MCDTLHYISEYPMLFAQINVTGVSCLVNLVLLRALSQYQWKSDSAPLDGSVNDSLIHLSHDSKTSLCPPHFPCDLLCVAVL